MLLEVNSKAPDFELPDQNGQTHQLADYYGSWVLLYFYPKDDTPGCTKEACAIRDNLPNFEKLQIKVLGVSVDSVESHRRFAEKYQLPFTVLADKNKEVVQKYAVWQKKRMMGRKYMGTVRTSYLINPAGQIAKVYPQVKPEVHAREVIADLKHLQQSSI